MPDLEDAEVGNTVKAFFRQDDPAAQTRPAPTSTITRDGGWFGGAARAPDAPLSSPVLTERDYADLTGALTRNGFGGPTSYYLNHEVNARYADSAPGGRVLQPVLFVGAAYDQVADLDSPTMLDACVPPAQISPRPVSPPGTGCSWRQRER